MFQKVSIITALAAGFTGYKQVSMELVLQNVAFKSVINSGFVQSIQSKQLESGNLDLASLQRKKMTTASWWKGKNEDFVFLFEFLKKEFEEIQFKLRVIDNNTTREEIKTQPLVPGFYVDDTIIYLIRLTDL